MNVVARQEEEKKNEKTGKREAGKKRKTVDQFQRSCVLPFLTSQWLIRSQVPVYFSDFSFFSKISSLFLLLPIT